MNVNPTSSARVRAGFLETNGAGFRKTDADRARVPDRRLRGRTEDRVLFEPRPGGPVLPPPWLSEGAADCRTGARLSPFRARPSGLDGGRVAVTARVSGEKSADLSYWCVDFSSGRVLGPPFSLSRRNARRFLRFYSQAKCERWFFGCARKDLRILCWDVAEHGCSTGGCFPWIWSVAGRENSWCLRLSNVGSSCPWFQC